MIDTLIDKLASVGVDPDETRRLVELARTSRCPIGPGDKRFAYLLEVAAYSCDPAAERWLLEYGATPSDSDVVAWQAERRIGAPGVYEIECECGDVATHYDAGHGEGFCDDCWCLGDDHGW